MRVSQHCFLPKYNCPPKNCPTVEKYQNNGMKSGHTLAFVLTKPGKILFAAFEKFEISFKCQREISPFERFCYCPTRDELTKICHGWHWHCHRHCHCCQHGHRHGHDDPCCLDVWSGLLFVLTQRWPSCSLWKITFIASWKIIFVASRQTFESKSHFWIFSIVPQNTCWMGHSPKK